MGAGSGSLAKTADDLFAKSEPDMTVSHFTIEPQTAQDLDTIETMLDAAFGLDRRTRSSYRLREGEEPVEALSLVAREGDRLVGTVRFWPVIVGEGREALLLGPLAVHPDRRNCGIGVRLMETALDKARELGHGLVILVGDEPYYRRVGFARVPDGRLLMPGPTDPDRMLYRELVPGALDGAEGLVLSPGRWRELDGGRLTAPRDTMPAREAAAAR